MPATQTLTPTATITPEYDPTTHTKTYRVTVAHGSGTSAVHGLTYAAAQATGARMLAEVPAESSEPSRLVAVAGAGRLTGR